MILLMHFLMVFILSYYSPLIFIFQCSLAFGTLFSYVVLSKVFGKCCVHYEDKRNEHLLIIKLVNLIQNLVPVISPWTPN